MRVMQPHRRLWSVDVAGRLTYPHIGLHSFYEQKRGLSDISKSIQLGGSSPQNLPKGALLKTSLGLQRRRSDRQFLNPPLFWLSGKTYPFDTN